MNKNIQKIFESFDTILNENKSFLKEASASSDSLLGGASVSIPSDGAHKGQAGWQSNNAWDIKASVGSPVYALADGTLQTFKDYGKNIIKTKGKKLYGQSFTVKSEGGLPDVYYTHLYGSPLKQGDKIQCGQFIGYVMDMPGSSYDHVHIGVETGHNIREFLNSDGTLKCNGQVIPGEAPTSDSEESSEEGSEQKPNSQNSSFGVGDTILKDFIGKLGKAVGLSESQELKNNTKKIISELTVSPSEVNYSTMKFADRTKNDEINKALLDDLDTAAKTAGVDITIDFAKTGHKKNTKSGGVSRHWTNNAVDIDYIDGKVVSPRNRDVVDKFVNVLISMGYTKNAEGGNPKSVLTFGFPGHDNHVHVSNTTNNTSRPDEDVLSDMGTSDSQSSETDQESEKTSSQKTTPNVGDKILGDFIGKLGQAVGLSEAKIYGSFGRNIKDSSGSFILPKDNNTSIYSPVSGVINNIKSNLNCKNQITIYHEVNGKEYHLEFCGITKKNVRNGQSVIEGSLLGKTDEDVQISLYNDDWRKVDLRSAQKFEKSSKDTDKSKKTGKSKKPEYSYKEKKSVKSYRSPSGYQDPAVDFFGSILTYPFRYKERKKEDNEKKSMFASPTSRNQREPGFLIDLFRKKKVDEDIERIKKLLK